MTTPIAFGWDVKMALMVERRGRLFVTSTFWTRPNRYPSYPGFDGHGNKSSPFPSGYEFRDQSRAITNAIVTWLTGKTTGANILVLTDNVGPVDNGHDYSLEFQAALTYFGHTFTMTGHGSSFEGYEPLDYDMMFMANSLSAFSYRGLVTAQEKVDFLLASRFAICGLTGTPNVWADYGMVQSGAHADNFLGIDHGYHIHQTSYGPYGGDNDGWLSQIPFFCEPLGSEMFVIVRPASDPGMILGTNTKGGTSTFYHCAVPEDRSLYEDHYYLTGDVGACGTWESA